MLIKIIINQHFTQANWPLYMNAENFEAKVLTHLDRIFLRKPYLILNIKYMKMYQIRLLGYQFGEEKGSESPILGLLLGYRMKLNIIYRRGFDWNSNYSLMIDNYQIGLLFLVGFIFPSLEQISFLVWPESLTAFVCFCFLTFFLPDLVRSWYLAFSAFMDTWDDWLYRVFLQLWGGGGGGPLLLKSLPTRLAQAISYIMG